MLATVGHELRTPLTSIRGYIETLLDGDELDALTTRRFLETARREAVRLGRMVDGMLEFSLLDLSAGMDGDECCDVVEQLHATIDALLPLAQQRGVTIDTTLPRTAAAHIGADACLHALLNVVENAIKHGREGGRVAIGCTKEGASVTVTVDDDGPGISIADRDRIFALGTRGGDAHAAGSGIGLAVVKAIVTRAGGEVSVDASLLGGARFVLRLPKA